MESALVIFLVYWYFFFCKCKEMGKVGRKRCLT